MGAQKCRADRDCARRAQRARAQHADFARPIEAIARLDLDRRGPFRDQRVEAGQGAGDKIALARRARGAHGRDDAAAAPRDFFIGHAFEAHLELGGAVAAVDQVGVAIDQARRDPAARAIDDLPRIKRRGIGRRPGIDDPAILGRDHAVVHGADVACTGCHPFIVASWAFFQIVSVSMPGAIPGACRVAR
jgi:hypothetical protein